VSELSFGLRRMRPPAREFRLLRQFRFGNHEFEREALRTPDSSSNMVGR
jgi:hypothetical protein